MNQETKIRYNVYHVRELGRGQTAWNKVGVAFPHEKDGKGFSIILDSLPLPLGEFDGRLTARIVEKKDEETSPQAS